jgi:hypothetical protein
MAIKNFVVLLVALGLASFRLADAQQPRKVPRIGFLFGRRWGNKCSRY